MASTTSLNSADANKLVLEAYVSGWMTYQPKYPAIFTEREPQRVDERFSVTASGGYIPSVDEAASFPQVNIAQVGIKTYSQAVYKEALPVTELMKRFDNYGVVIEEASKQGYRARLTMDRVGANILNNAFTSETTWDGEYLFDSDHEIGQTGSTQSNLLTGQLTESNLNTAITNLRNMKDHNNQVMGLTPRTLVVSPTFAKKAFELTASQGAPESANNNSNFFNTLGLNVVVWEQLTDSDAWFLMADKMFTYFRYLVGIAPKMEFVRRPETGNYEYQCQFSVVAGCPDYLGAFGSRGA